MQQKEYETFYPKSRQDWRLWLAENHSSKQSVWLIYHKKKSGKRSLSWSEAVDEAICFGWVDSTAKTIDEDTYMQFFSKRKPKSVWSKINKVKVEQLTQQGLITQAGFDSINTAKENGSWTILDEVEDLVIPSDLQEELNKYPGASEYFLSLSNSGRKMMLYWVVMAKRPETRHKRICEIAEQAGEKRKPKQFR